MNIRKAKLKDVSQIVDFAVDLLNHHEKFDPNYAPAKNVKKVYKKWITRCIHSNNRHLIVAEDNDNIIGYALAETSTKPPVFKLRKYGYISDMYVTNKYRGKGVAKALLKDLAYWFRNKRLDHIELTVHAKNELALNAWKKYGFEEYTSNHRIKLGKLLKI